MEPLIAIVEQITLPFAAAFLAISLYATARAFSLLGEYRLLRGRRAKLAGLKRALQEGDLPLARELASGDGGACARFVSRALSRPPAGSPLKTDGEAAEVAGLLDRASVFRFLGNSSITVGMAGTVVGMIQMFRKGALGLPSAGQAGPQAAALLIFQSGLGVALYTTLIGLVLSLAYLSAAYYARRKIIALLRDLESLRQALEETARRRERQTGGSDQAGEPAENGRTDHRPRIILPSLRWSSTEWNR